MPNNRLQARGFVGLVAAVVFAAATGSRRRRPRSLAHPRLSRHRPCSPRMLPSTEQRLQDCKQKSPSSRDFSWAVLGSNQ
jgi:hypothetical protein